MKPSISSQCSILSPFCLVVTYYAESSLEDVSHKPSLGGMLVDVPTPQALKVPSLSLTIVSIITQHSSFLFKRLSFRGLLKLKRLVDVLFRSQLVPWKRGRCRKRDLKYDSKHESFLAQGHISENSATGRLSTCILNVGGYAMGGMSQVLLGAFMSQ